MSIERSWQGRILDLVFWVVLAEELARARIRTRFLPTRKLRASISPSESVQTPQEGAARLHNRPQLATLHRVRRLLPAVAKRVPWRAMCLEQALAGEAILKCVGIPCTIRLGVALDDGDFAAHAWLEVGGRIVLGKHSKLTFQTFT